MKYADPSLRFKPAQLLSAVLLAFAGQVTADDATLLSQIVVTSSTYEQPIQDVQASVQVLNSRDLAATPGTTLAEGLKQAVGVDTRGTSANSTVSMRGMSSSGTLILYDGLRRTQKYGSRDINLYSTEDVERVEIVRGPMSALYGADASGGVINVITRMPKLGSGLHGGAQVVYGAAQGGERLTDLWNGYFEYGGESMTHRVSLQQRNRDDFRLNEGSGISDLNGVKETYLNYHGGLQLAPGHKLRLGLEYVRQDNEGDDRLATAPFATFTDYEKERRNFGNLGYTGELGPGVLNIDFAKGKTKASTTRAFPLVEETNYDQTQFAGSYVLPISAHTLTVGLGQLNDQLNITNNTSREGDRTNRYLFGQADLALTDSLSVLAGLRHDAFNEFDSATTPRLSVQFKPGNWSFRAGYGEAFRAPSVLEQYATFRRQRFLIVGSSSLQPEESRSIEAAIGFATARVRAELLAYRTNTKNLIETVQSPRLASDPLGVATRATYTNIGRAEIEGIELTAAWQMTDGLSLRGAYEYIDARDLATGSRLLGRPGTITRAAIRYDRGPWSTDLQARYYGNYYNTHNSVRGATLVSDYGTTDIKVAYRMTTMFSLAAGIDNIFNRMTPDNWGAQYSLADPPTRFAYVTGNVTF